MPTQVIIVKYIGIALTAILAMCLTAGIVTSFHNDNATVQKAVYDADRAKAEAEKAKSEADAEMWRKMPNRSKVELP